MIFFKTIAELQQTIRVDATFKLLSLEPFEIDAIEKYVIPYIGEELYEVLKTGYIDDTLTPELTALLPYVQRVDARFSFVHGSASLNIKIGETGYTTYNTQTQVVASKERTKELNDSMRLLAWDAVESLLAFLEKNVDDYTEWEESTAYTLALRNFINSALDYDEIIDIKKSRLRFMELRKHMDFIEQQYIYPVISTAMAEDIITELKEGTLSANYLTIIEDLKRADAYFAANEFASNPQQLNRAQSYLSNVVETLYASPDDFPLWKASDSYDEDRDSSEQFENNDDDQSKMYVFGGPAPDIL